MGFWASGLSRQCFAPGASILLPYSSRTCHCIFHCGKISLVATVACRPLYLLFPGHLVYYVGKHILQVLRVIISLIMRFSQLTETVSQYLVRNFKAIRLLMTDDCF